MCDSAENDRNEAKLWAGYHAAEKADGRAPGTDLIAAWVEGRCSPEERDFVEQALASDPGLLDSVAAVREALNGADTDVPTGLAARISASLPGAYRMPSRGAAAGGFVARWWKVAAAAVLITVASASGFIAGSMRAPAQTGSAGTTDLTEIIVEDWGWEGVGLDAVVEVIEE